MSAAYQEFCRRIGYEFNDEALLKTALTHRSHGEGNNERLEFLGDSLLNLIIAEELFRKYQDLKEGDLSRLRAELVKGRTLAELASEMEFGSKLILGAGERSSGGHRRESILADAVEAVIGAIYLDSDFEGCRERVLAWYASRLETLNPKANHKDPKTRLQELMQSQGFGLPEYALMKAQGLEHQQVFTVSCKVAPLKSPLTASARSRRLAEQAAAEQVLQLLENEQ